MVCSDRAGPSCPRGIQPPQAVRQIHLSKNAGHNRSTSGNDLLPAFQIAGSRSCAKPVLFFWRSLKTIVAIPEHDPGQCVPHTPGWVMKSFRDFRLRRWPGTVAGPESTQTGLFAGWAIEHWDSQNSRVKQRSNNLEPIPQNRL